MSTLGTKNKLPEWFRITYGIVGPFAVIAGLLFGFIERDAIFNIWSGKTVIPAIYCHLAAYSETVFAFAALVFAVRDHGTTRRYLKLFSLWALFFFLQLYLTPWGRALSIVREFRFQRISFDDLIQYCALWSIPGSAALIVLTGIGAILPPAKWFVRNQPLAHVKARIPLWLPFLIGLPGIILCIMLFTNWTYVTVRHCALLVCYPEARVVMSYMKAAARGDYKTAANKLVIFDTTMTGPYHDEPSVERAELPADAFGGDPIIREHVLYDDTAQLFSVLPRYYDLSSARVVNVRRPRFHRSDWEEMTVKLPDTHEVVIEMKCDNSVWDKHYFAVRGKTPRGSLIAYASLCQIGAGMGDGDYPPSLAFGVGYHHPQGLTQTIGLHLTYPRYADFSLRRNEEPYRYYPPGTIWAWGSNEIGALGDGTDIYRYKPIALPGLSDVASLAPGLHIFAVRNDGTLWVLNPVYWMHPALQPLVSDSPHALDGFAGVVSALSNDRYVMARLSDGSVWLSDFQPHSQPTPEQFTVFSTPIRLRGADFTKKLIVHDDCYYLLKDDGTLWSGPELSRDLAGGDTNFIPLNGVDSVTAIVSTYEGVFLLRSDGTVYRTIGKNDSIHPSGESELRFTKIQGLSDVISITPSLALKKDGTVWAWNKDILRRYGRTSGRNQFDDVVQIPEIKDAVAIFGDSSCFAITKDGSVYAWGYNANGELGLGDVRNRWVPEKIKDLSDVVDISSESRMLSLIGSHVLALKKGGSVWAWGTNDCGQLGDGTNIDRFAPVQVKGLRDVTVIHATRGRSYAITK